MTTMIKQMLLNKDLRSNSLLRFSSSCTLIRFHDNFFFKLFFALGWKKTWTLFKAHPNSSISLN
ncbi:hypothetical protein HPP92_020466 [Vanilla planifolia]|uniref:Uncharacterized protein n=1 Tax=Vanilla planifolia TaxID=51239 RepID=A0A835QAS5_VANPL|nr:hypothetical protein HPP92_020466 [Vanilla planifolia]